MLKVCHFNPIPRSGGEGEGRMLSEPENVI